MTKTHISLLTVLTSTLLFVLLMLHVGRVDATATHLGTWNRTYPDSDSSSTQCQLCHIRSAGGNGWNAYGWGIREGRLSGMLTNEAILEMEITDSDGNGISDLTEIMGGFQPGWTDGAVHTSYSYDLTTSETVTEADQTAPIAIAELDTLDPVLPIENPIPDPIPTGELKIGLVKIAEGLLSPVLGTFTPSLPDYLFIVDQPGQIYQFNLISQEMSVFLDISDQLVTLGAFGNFDERGLLGLAFHPDYANNGLLYTFQSEPVNGDPTFPTTVPDGILPNSQTVLSEWRVDDPASPTSVVDPSSERELFRVDKPQFNHNGADILFGPDGMLYITIGDGGGADDTDGQPFLDDPMSGHLDGNGQDPTNVLGTILRIDPAGDNAGNGQYGIPADNPFVSDATILDEIYAYGLRNVYRMSFDPNTGELYAGDIGQNDIEELNIIKAGGNYGWNYKEGTFFFVDNGAEEGYVTDIDPGGLPTDLIDPIAQYDHDEGISIINGFHYTGVAYSDLVGRYILGDWSRNFTTPLGRLFYLNESNEIVEFDMSTQPPFNYFLQGFGQDANGEIYVLGNKTGTPYPDEETGENTGVIFQITEPVPTAITLVDTHSTAHSSQIVFVLLGLFLVTVLLVRPTPTSSD